MIALPGDSMNGAIAAERRLPVLDDVGGQRLQPGGRAVHGVDHGDRLLDPRPLDVVEPERRLVGGRVELLLGDVAGEPHRDQPRLEVDRHRGAVLDRAGEVVGVDDLAEHLLRVAVGEGDRRAGEGDERGVGQGVADVAGEAVEVVVVAAVRLVDDHDDVAPVGEQRVVEPGVALGLGAGRTSAAS